MKVFVAIVKPSTSWLTDNEKEGGNMLTGILIKRGSKPSTVVADGEVKGYQELLNCNTIGFYQTPIDGKVFTIVYDDEYLFNPHRETGTILFQDGNDEIVGNIDGPVFITGWHPAEPIAENAEDDDDCDAYCISLTDDEIKMLRERIMSDSWNGDYHLTLPAKEFSIM